MAMPQVRSIDLKAVLAGFVLDTFGTMAVFVVLMTAMSSVGISEKGIIERMNSVSGLLLSLIIGLGCTFLGGYVAGRIAKKAEVLQGALVAGAGLVLGLVLHESGTSLWYEVLGYVLIIPAGMAGGYAALHHRRKGRAAVKG